MKEETEILSVIRVVRVALCHTVTHQVYFVTFGGFWPCLLFSTHLALLDKPYIHGFFFKALLFKTERKKSYFDIEPL